MDEVKPATLRKRKERERKKAEGIKPAVYNPSENERRMLDFNRDYRGGYDENEYIRFLIRRDHEELAKIGNLGTCDYCGKQLPQGCEGKWKGAGDCFKTIKERELLSL